MIRKVLSVLGGLGGGLVLSALATRLYAVAAGQLGLTGVLYYLLELVLALIALVVGYRWTRRFLLSRLGIRKSVKGWFDGET